VRSLELNPQKFDIELRVTSWERNDGDTVLADIKVKLGDDICGNTVVTEAEARRIGSWFQELAVNLSRNQKKAREKK
jgi:hypothetical protein